MQLMSALKAGAVVAALTFATQAGAVPLNGSVVLGGTSDTAGADLLSRTSFTVSGANATNTAGDFNGAVSSGTQVSVAAFSTASPVAFTVRSDITGQFGTFTSTSFTQVTRSSSLFSGLFTGTFTPDVPGPVDGFEGGAASFRFTLTNTGSFSGTLALPPEAVAAPTVPEPASMALLGVGLLGLGLVRRKAN